MIHFQSVVRVSGIGSSNGRRPSFVRRQLRPTALFDFQPPLPDRRVIAFLPRNKPRQQQRIAVPCRQRCHRFADRQAQGFSLLRKCQRRDVGKTRHGLCLAEDRHQPGSRFMAASQRPGHSIDGSDIGLALGHQSTDARCEPESMICAGGEAPCSSSRPAKRPHSRIAERPSLQAKR